MKRYLLALSLATAMAPALALTAAPAAAQTRPGAALAGTQRRFDNERNIYERERARYEDASRRGGRGGYRDRNRDDGYGGDDRYRWGGGSSDWDGSRYYREDPRYEERRLGSRTKSIAVRTAVIIAAVRTAPPVSSSAPASAPWSAAASTPAASAPPAPWSAACLAH